jgi:dienelactone hydrolase
MTTHLLNAKRQRLAIAVFFLSLATVDAAGNEPERVTHANYKQAFHYSNQFLSQYVYDGSVAPNWIGKTDSFWYSYRTSQGTRYWRVDPGNRTKTPLFDHAKLAALLSEAVQKPLDAALLPLTRVTMNEEGTSIKFVIDDTQYGYDLQTEKLTKLGKAPAGPRGFPGGGRGGFGRGFQGQQGGENQQQQQGRRGGFRAGAGQGGQPPSRFPSPDRSATVLIRNHNLYLQENGDDLSDGQAEAKPIQLSTDSTEGYSFGNMPTFGAGMDDDIPPPQTQWSRDSKAFWSTRIDSRGVADLFVINSTTMPRPTLEQYRYPMPGEAAARKMELFVCNRGSHKLIRVAPKWKEEAYADIHWGKTSGELRFVRRDRFRRHAELCSTNVRTGETRCLISEGFENADLMFQMPQYVDETDEMIWWSERTGWGHYYLYDRNGKLKNAITSGPYRASRIVAVDPKNRLLFFVGNGREAGENVYYEHLYNVHLDGNALTLMDPGNANHEHFAAGGFRRGLGGGFMPPGGPPPSNLSPSRHYLVDNSTRVDMAPVAILRDAAGKEILKLEQADLSRLYQVGWKMPERFEVKAADGVTDLYGNLWKPFDFDGRKKYPVIVHVYPGPQTEGVTHSFSALSGEQQLAQIGFIVVQVGHRGGTPTRSKAYGSYGYANLRDYALADTKSAVEQLAARCSYMDIDRVGIYGHSGGGFMSATAVLQKPYNEFFKAAVASSGNHDNNIYNNGWAERYHGMKEVAVQKETPSGAGGATGASDTGPQNQATQKAGSDKAVEKDAKGAMRYDIKVPTNAELAANLKGALLLVHGELDNNVHPASTMRLVDALIKANKRFDMIILPGQRHGYGQEQAYFQQRLWDFFADHLLGDRQIGADVYEKREIRN